MKEGNLEAPKRAPIDWKNPEYYDQQSLEKEMERVFDACHGCRRCVSLCDSFPTLFDLIDESDTFEVDGVDKSDYIKVVDECFLCDLCAETKCPYLPPHEWAIDFPHLMLRAKAIKHESKKSRWRDKVLTSTDVTLGTASSSGIAPIVNKALGSKTIRKVLDKTVGIHPEAPVPKFARPTKTTSNSHVEREDTQDQLKVAIFATCYDKNTESSLIEDLMAILNHNAIHSKIIWDANCCGMPKLELGDLKQVERAKNANLPHLIEAVDEGYQIVSAIPSCVLMFKQELPLMFPEQQELTKIKDNFFDPFEYLMLQVKQEKINLDFKHSLGKISYHAACHQRVQNVGAKTREFLNLIPGSEVDMIERCSGHDGTYAVRSESYEKALKIARPVQRQIRENNADYVGSDCPMAGRLITHNSDTVEESVHPLTMVRHAYGI